MKNQSKQINVNESLMGLVVAIVGVIYLVLTLMLKDARVGSDPMAPKYFPLMISAMFIVLGLFFFLKTGPMHVKASLGNIKQAIGEDLDVYRTIALTAVNTVVYGLLFKRIGYVLSTVLFLEVMLYLTRGKKFVPNTVISVIFSVVIYFLFSKLLGVMLPPMPFMDI